MNAAAYAYTPGAALSAFWKRLHNEFLKRQQQLNFWSEPNPELPRSVAPPRIYKKQQSLLEFLRELRQIPLHAPCTEKWDGADMAAAHFLLFDRGLNALTTSGSKEEKLEILSWIFAPVTQEKLIKGKLCRVHVSDIPFSFYRCAREYGIADVDGLKAELLNHLDVDVSKKLDKFLQLYH